MHKLRLYLHYYKVLLPVNLPFSLFMSLTGLMFEEHVVIRMINSFSLCLLTGGFVLAAYFFDQRFSDQYYFYHNQGLSKVSLIVGAYLINVVVALLLFGVKVYLYAYV